MRRASQQDLAAWESFQASIGFERVLFFGTASPAAIPASASFSWPVSARRGRKAVVLAHGMVLKTLASRPAEPLALRHDERKAERERRYEFGTRTGQPKADEKGSTCPCWCAIYAAKEELSVQLPGWLSRWIVRLSGLWSWV